MNKFTFPFDTCETPNKTGVAQPWSAFVNLVNCVIVFYFLLKTKHVYTFALLLSLLCFELFHMFSHIVHIPGLFVQNTYGISLTHTTIVHSLAYLVNLSFIYTLYRYTKQIPSYVFILYLVVLVCFDIYSVFHLPVIYYLLTQTTILLSLFAYYFTLLPNFIQNSVYQIAFFAGILILLVLNEMYNCGKMQSFYPHFPYHIFIEMVGVILFYIISSNFYKL
jgi:hypothetical protein